MRRRPELPTFVGMSRLARLHWPLIAGLGALALVRPLTSVIQHQLGIAGSPAIPISITVLISAVWVLAVGLSRVASPLLTLVLTGLLYGVLSIVLSAVLSPLLSGRLEGPLAHPFAIVPVLGVNALWGLVAGALATAIRRWRNDRESERAAR